MFLFILCSFLVQGVCFSKGEIKKELCCQKDNKDVYLFTLKNDDGMVAEISNFGGVIYRLYVPDRNRKLANVVLGLDSVQNYFRSNPHFGALIGRFSNRIANASFTLDSMTYHLTVNSHHKNTIHGGAIGFDKIVWNATDSMTNEGPSLQLTHLSPDGHEGFPGNLSVTVVYTLTNENALRIDYYATTDKPTVVNFTNHCYFNLAGEGNGDVLRHQMTIRADKYTPVDDEGIPTGEIKDVAGTPYDFRTPRAIGSSMLLPQGYDNNFVLNHPLNQLGLAATVFERESGRTMEVFTTEPGVQFFTAHGLNGTFSGESGKKYESSYGFCLETEHFPDSPHRPNFPSTVLRPGEKFHSITLFKFSVRKD
ncbi:MAG TPA: aldose epimerase family protein [Bacteroidota bacterium]|nr:aldose epimerase family protein [Bacteroidota bacterium]